MGSIIWDFGLKRGLEWRVRGKHLVWPVHLAQNYSDWRMKN